MFKRYFLSIIILILAPFGAIYPKNIVILGDSLSAAYGIDLKKGWVARLKDHFNVNHKSYKIINLSVSGYATSNGLTQIRHYFKNNQANIIVVQLGSNDALRGLSLKSMKANLAKIIAISKNHKSQVLLIANRLPPNYGKAYTLAFAKVYRDLSEHYKVPLVPHFLKGVAEETSWMQSDGLHPNEQGQAQILANVIDQIKYLISFKGIK